MSNWIGDDRRKRDRSECSDKFRCYMTGKRFIVPARDLGPGGAFLLLDRVVRPGGIVVMEIVRPGYVGKPPHLVAKVVHFSFAPTMGAGVKWLKAISDDGVTVLGEFLSENLGVQVDSEEAVQLRGAGETNRVSYDFLPGRLKVERPREAKGPDKMVSMFGIKVSERTMDKLGLGDVRVVHSEAPKQKRAVIGDDQSLDTRDAAKIDPLEAAKRLEEWMRFKKIGRPLNKHPVVLAFDGRNVDAQALSLSGKNIFVQASSLLPDAGKRLLVQFPIETAKKAVKIIIVAEVQKTIQDKSLESWGCALRIITVNEGDNIGTFKRFLGHL